MIVSDKQLCDCCADVDTQISYLKLILKCPTCRRIHASPLTQQVITDLRITDKMMVKLILDFNYCVNKEIESNIEYTDEFSSEDEDELENNICYRITGLMYPKIERDDLINMMLMMNLRHLLDFS
jgi:hypothetical protein